MESVKRRYPRVSVETKGELALESAMERGSDGPQVTFPVTIRSISTGGAGLALPEGGGQRLAPGARVVVSFEGSQRFELPGRIAWCAGEGYQSSPYDLGIHFQLERVGKAVRDAYARWVVGLVQRSQRSPEFE
jgi:hypothetical protein